MDCHFRDLPLRLVIVASKLREIVANPEDDSP